MMSNELADFIFDPRGENRFYELQLAPHASLQALRDGKVLFLTIPNYIPVITAKYSPVLRRY